uniref:Macaca fascicularis brain cDNA clone: QflA-20007, similar to human flavin containing monooxygenase 2 (FMO2), mRNA, RefSeq: NM_001460.1 n=1 Tax=Macaca fascicularis TaxID=9541 RepID=I7GN96_MACFA|nr:unnamed protein product [Macaca fascicularis]
MRDLSPLALRELKILEECGGSKRRWKMAEQASINLSLPTPAKKCPVLVTFQCPKIFQTSCIILNFWNISGFLPKNLIC